MIRHENQLLNTHRKFFIFDVMLNYYKERNNCYCDMDGGDLKIYKSKLLSRANISNFAIQNYFFGPKLLKKFEGFEGKG